MPKTNSKWQAVWAALIYGAVSAGILAILMMVIAAAGKDVLTEKEYYPVTGKTALLIAAVICGVLCSRKNETGKFKAAMLGQLSLLIALFILALCCGSPVFSQSFALDVLCLIAGAFIGALCSGSGHRGHHRKTRFGKYRK